MKPSRAAVVHADGDADDDRAFRLGEPLEHAGIEVDVGGHGHQLTSGHLKGRRAFIERIGRPRASGLAIGRRVDCYGSGVGPSGRSPANRRTALAWTKLLKFNAAG